MTPSPSPVAAVLAELRRHDIGAFNGSQVGCTCDRTWRTTDEWRKHVAADLARLVQEAKADELEQLADWNDERPDMRVSRASIANVLRNQAQRLRSALAAVDVAEATE